MGRWSTAAPWPEARDRDADHHQHVLQHLGGAVMTVAAVFDSDPQTRSRLKTILISVGSWDRQIKALASPR